MSFEIFLNFNGNAREAAEFYAGVFRTEVKNLMTFGESPADPNFPIKDAERDFLMYAEVKIGDKNIMFMDNSADFPVKFGNNITPVLTLGEKEELTRIFDEIKVGGKVHMAPQKTFFAEYYAMVEDKFGIVWQLMCGEVS